MEIYLNEDELIQMVQELVAIPSHYKAPGGEFEVAKKLEEIALREGLEVSMEEITPGRCNVEIKLTGKKEYPHLLLCGHMDTVTSEGMEIDPFNGYVENEKIWGRGSVDMKGGLASMLYSMIYIKRRGDSNHGKVTFIGTVGEECPNKSDGAYALRRRGKFADMAIIGEPTRLNIAVAHKGTLSLEIEIKGKAAHSSNPGMGDSAIYKAVDLINLIKNELLPQLQERRHPLCGAATLNIGTIRGGIQNNIVPDKCIFSLNRRYIPGEKEEDIIKEINDLWAKLPYGENDISIKVLEETENRIPMETDVNEEIVVRLVDLCKKLGINSNVYGANYWTDGAHLRAIGIPTVIFGPGDIKEAHSAREYIEIDSLTDAAKAYISFILELKS